MACVTEGGPPESELVDLDGGKEYERSVGTSEEEEEGGRGVRGRDKGSRTCRNRYFHTSISSFIRASHSFLPPSFPSSLPSSFPSSLPLFLPPFFPSFFHPSSSFFPSFILSPYRPNAVPRESCVREEMQVTPHSDVSVVLTLRHYHTYLF